MATVTVDQWRLAQRLTAEFEEEDLRIEIPKREPDLRRDAVRGAVLGAAIGDALGHPTEFVRSIDEIRRRFGLDGVRGYALYWERNGRRFAPYTDDTQLAEAVLRTLVWSRARRASLDETMQSLSKRFVAWAYAPQGGHRAPGIATLAGCRALAAGVPWNEAGAADAGGCGSVMRAYPFGVVFWDDRAKAERWAVEHSRLTHGFPAALAACGAMAVGISCILSGEQGAALDAMITAARREHLPTAERMEEALGAASRGATPEQVLEGLQGWSAEEAIAAAVYLFARHGSDFHEAVLCGANSPGDSDSIASLAGALSGAASGSALMPQEWRTDLERMEDLRKLADAAWALGVPDSSARG